MTEIQSSQVFKLSSLIDLVRLVVTQMNTHKRAGYLYYAEKDGKHIYAMSHLIHGWYNLRGLPVTLIAHAEEHPQTNFIAYNLGTDTTKESIDFVDYIKSSTQIVHIPIIKVDQFPDFLL
ncbi:MAG: hypothetical protein ACXAD7_18750 [Candidatus Kariarchaeaceae archaeon]|jgi:hypothetical protein